ncbi:outer membrane protein transport protein [Uliginosibacterium sp. 31-16]|uniref:OmpP1/FadL family transporter n=1 Tax=Uliginosibacterium sp. 31-16 TaxID=3068315 RepID=UPI00273E38E1|nr:outer membrane protein transport protein [Uliginosibacterium sp. 31-16]MDP5238501.1 outer membrane protein transport protein [Uliginosibacterium sp. 31-16]
MTKTMLSRTITAATALLAAQGASASGFQLQEQNASGLGNSYAGSAAVAENASTIFFNPAGMTKLQDREFSLGLNLIRPSYKYTNEGSSVAPASTGSNGGDAGSIAALPNGYMSWALNKDWYLGLGFGAPFGLKTEYDEDWVGRFQSIKFDIKTYNINPSLAWRINDMVSVGAGVNWQRMEAEYVRKAAVINSLAQNTTITLDADNDSWGWNAGALFTLSPDTKLGISYRSAVKHELSGTLTSDNQLVSPDVSARADITLPDTWILSVAQKMGPDWELLGDLSRTGWAKIQNVDVWRTSGSSAGQATPAQTLDVHFRNTWRAALGATQKLNEQWKMKYGIAYDQSPVRGADTRLVSLPDNNRTWLSLGAQYKFNKTSTIDVGAAYLLIKETTVDNDQSAKGRGRVTGRYDGSVAILGVQYSQSF